LDFHMADELEMMKNYCVNSGCDGLMFLHITLAQPWERVRNTALGKTEINGVEVPIKSAFSRCVICGIELTVYSLSYQ